jgi:hypothetical protein
MQLLPALLNNWGVSNDWLTILFGIGVVFTLTTAPRGIAEQFPKDMARLGGLLVRLVRRTKPVPALPPAPAAAPAAAPAPASASDGEAP